MGWNVSHLVEIVGWAKGTLALTSWDINPVGGPRYQTHLFESRHAALEAFDSQVATAKKSIAAVTDEEMQMMWSLLDGGKPVITMPRAAIFRSFVLNHLIHHRAILCVYLRLNDIPVPGMYGPSGE